MTNGNRLKPHRRDGTDLLLGRFDEDGSEWVAVGQWWVQVWSIIGYTVVERPIQLAFEPTHWMPLPEPPK